MSSKWREKIRREHGVEARRYLDSLGVEADPVADRDPEMAAHHIVVSDVSNIPIACLRWKSSTEYLVYSWPDNELIGKIEVAQQGFALWGAFKEVMLKTDVDKVGSDPIKLAAWLAREHAEEGQREK